MKLSKRLKTVASFVSRGSNVADIGTDHGYVPIYLVREGIAAHAIAMDVREGPLLRAREHIRGYGLEGEIETRLSDGLFALKPGEADTVMIAGMGGDLIIHILEQGKHVWEGIGHLILSPQSELYKVRRYLKDTGFFSIADEVMLSEDGKFYTVMSVVPGRMEDQEYRHYLFGKCLIDKRDPVLSCFLEKERAQIEAVAARVAENDTMAARKRLLALEQELIWIKEAQDEMQ